MAVGVFACLLPGAAKSEDLVLPFSCAVERGAVHVEPANDTRYRLTSRRDEQSFSTCGPGDNVRCETMMVHRFNLDCGGQVVAWSQVASAATAFGVRLPARLPRGYAPVSRLGGRFVLPSLIRTETEPMRVVRQDLSPDSVVETYDSAPMLHTASWEPVITANFRTTEKSGAFEIAGIVSSLVALLLAASLIAVNWRRMPIPALASIGGRMREAVPGLERFAEQVTSFVRTAFSARGGVQDGARYDADDEIGNAIAAVNARIDETELVVATMPGDLLLKDVLRSEIGTIRARSDDIARRRNRQARQRTIGSVKTLMRDLDRIERIARGTRAQPSDRADDAQPSAPQTAFDAYRVLGINADAPQAAVKKVVDALRVSWHPDHARDEQDRVHREARIKQINAAWDIIRQSHRTGD